MQAPSLYENNREAPDKLNEEFLPGLINQMTWKANEDILDYGSGTGSVGYNYDVPFLTKYKSRLQCVDVSLPMVDFARSKYPHSRVTYLQGDIQDPSFKFDRKFDRIFSTLCLHYVKNYRKALSKFYNALKPNGQFGFTLIADCMPFYAMEAICSNPAWKPFTQGYQNVMPFWYESGEDPGTCLAEALNELGFKNIPGVEVHETNVNYKITVIVELLVSFNPCIKNIPEDRMKELMDAYRQFVTKFFDLSPDAEFVLVPYTMVTCLVENLHLTRKFNSGSF